MNILNKQVKHNSFGEGKVVEFTDSYIEVSFSSGNKKFVFPDALGTHLILVDEQTANRVDSIKQEIEKEREEQRIQEYEEQERMLQREKLIKKHKLSPVSQAAFWITAEEEETVFSDWKVFTGTKKSGPNAGEPNKLIRLHQNSACLITARESDEPEEDRRILGVFMVEENFVGKLCEDGYIPAHSVFRIRLTKEESQKMRFWTYYVNERYPLNMTWNSGRTRYFDNIWMAQILREILSLKANSPDLKIVQDFFEHFCQMNQLVVKDIPAPNGTLVRIAEEEKKVAK